ncbi:C-type lectin domain family 4 member F-like isoform X2, partial [Silurus asotus]
NQLQTSYTNLTKERDQLQTSYNNLTKERDQLQASYNNLTKERDQLQKERDLCNYNNLTKERDQLQTSYNNLTKERDQLQASYNNLIKERDQLQREKDLCKWKWISFSSSFYYVSNDNKSWEESRQNCRDKGTDLMIIKSREEQEFISKHISSISGVWIGLSDRDKEGEWKWVDGSLLTIKFWNQGEPNGKEKENCVEVYKTSNSIVWNDQQCSEKRNWICEQHVS